jgi:hypothetical protein
LTDKDDELIRWVLSHTNEYTAVSNDIKQLRVTEFALGHKVLAIDADNKPMEVVLSWTEAFMDERARIKNKCRLALRQEISDSIHEYRSQLNPEIVCSECKSVIEPDDVHIDHINYFAKIVQMWYAEEKVNDFSILTERKNRILQLTDRELAGRWKLYHDKQAQLRPLHARCNRKRPKYSPES